MLKVISRILSYATLTLSPGILGPWTVVMTTESMRFIMKFNSELIMKKLFTLISRFDVPKIPPHMINQLGIEKEATSNN
tara:strand:- start:145 stop:381 length:237 start_codon:yes stop_codon:yes gene_type:complete